MRWDEHIAHIGELINVCRT